VLRKQHQHLTEVRNRFDSLAVYDPSVEIESDRGIFPRASTCRNKSNELKASPPLKVMKKYRIRDPVQACLPLPGIPCKEAMKNHSRDLSKSLSERGFFKARYAKTNFEVYDTRQFVSYIHLRWNIETSALSLLRYIRKRGLYSRETVKIIRRLCYTYDYTNGYLKMPGGIRRTNRESLGYLFDPVRSFTKRLKRWESSEEPNSVVAPEGDGTS